MVVMALPDMQANVGGVIHNDKEGKVTASETRVS